VRLYEIVVFLHIVGALGLFAGVGLEQLGLARLRQARTVAQLREWVATLGGLRRIDGPSGLLLLITGGYMVTARWGGHGWIGLALLGMMAMAFLSIGVTGRRVTAIKKSIPMADGPISTSLHQRIKDPVLRASAWVRAALAFGILFNMSVKPGSVGASIVMAVALAVGVLFATRAGIGRRVDAPHHQGAGA